MLLPYILAINSCYPSTFTAVPLAVTINMLPELPGLIVAGASYFLLDKS